MIPLHQKLADALSRKDQNGLAEFVPYGWTAITNDATYALTPEGAAFLRSHKIDPDNLPTRLTQ